MAENDERWKSLVDDAVDYRQTVEALLTFAAFIVHDRESKRPNAEFGFGRRMTTSNANHVEPNKEVTPDLVAQKSLSYGIVAEAKKSLSRDQFQWQRYLTQLRKYDDALRGWWTNDEFIADSDTIMLIHQSRSRAFVRFMQSESIKNPSIVGPGTSVVEFSESPESGINIFFRLEYGKIKDHDLRTKLDTGIPIPLDKVVQSFSHIRYYDTQPPMALLLTNLWTDYFPSLLPDADYDEELDARRLRVSLELTTEELQKANGSRALYLDSRSSEFPLRSWIREAFERLVKHDLAVRSTDKNDEYIVLYRGFREDVSHHFAKLESGLSDKKTAKEEVQIKLFPEKSND